MNIKNFILSWEGGYANIEGDAGGATCSGVTLATYQQYLGENKTVYDLKNITQTEWDYVFHQGFWYKLKCDKIKDERLANFLVDWGWMSGTKTAAKAIQKLVGVKADGIIGNITLTAINNTNPTLLFYRLFNARQNYYEEIVKRTPTNAKFLLGWDNRLFDFLRQTL